MRLLHDREVGGQHLVAERSGIDEGLAFDGDRLTVRGLEHDRHIIAARNQPLQPRRFYDLHRLEGTVAAKDEALVVIGDALARRIDVAAESLAAREERG